MKLKPKNLVLFIIWVIPILSYSQKPKSVKNIYGKWVVSNDITIQEARDKALNEAKAEALKTAGVSEMISSTDLLFNSDGDKKSQSLFESLTSVDSYGEVSDYAIVKEEKKIDEFGNVIYQVWINADVVIHKVSKDQGFGFDFTGLTDSFNNHDKMSFIVKPWKNGYLKIFILNNEKEGMMVYPNSLEKVEILNQGQSYSFPRTKAMDYEMTTDKKSELNYLLLLFTKEDVTFRDEQTSQNILKYISHIRPNEKYLKSIPIVIKGSKD